MQRLTTVSFLVIDYDEAIDWFTRCLDFELIEDTPLGEGKRWVRVAAKDGGAILLLARAVGDRIAAVGHQVGGRVGFFLEVSDFEAVHARMADAGVRFEEPSRTEPYGKVAVFLDLYGNRWDLLEPARKSI